MVFVLFNVHLYTLYPLTYVYIYIHIYVYVYTHTSIYLIKNVWEKYKLNCTALIFRIHNCLPITFMTFLVNLITIKADHNLFLWLKINETNCCDITVSAKQEQTMRQTSFLRLHQLKCSEYPKEIKIMSSTFTFPPLQQSRPLNHRHYSHRWL